MNSVNLIKLKVNLKRSGQWKLCTLSGQYSIILNLKTIINHWFQIKLVFIVSQNICNNVPEK